MDKVVEKIATFRAAVSRYAKAAREFIATTAGKPVLVAVALIAITAYAHHRGAVSVKAKLLPQIEELQNKLASVTTVTVREPVEDAKRRADELAERLSQSEAAKASLQSKVNDYEKQLGRRPAKAGAFTLSPADARSLSNIK